MFGQMRQKKVRAQVSRYGSRCRWSGSFTRHTAIQPGMRTCNGNDTFPRHVTRAPLPRYIIYHFAVICIDTEYPSLSPFARTRLVASIGFEIVANTRMERITSNHHSLSRRINYTTLHLSVVFPSIVDSMTMRKTFDEVFYFEELQINIVVIIYYPLFSEGGNFRGKCFFSVSVRFTIRSLRIYLSSYLPPSIPSRIQIHLRPTLVTGSPTPPPAKGYRENRQERPYREKKKSPRMVQSYLSYPFHVNTHTHTRSKLFLSTRLLPSPSFHSPWIPATVTNDALSVVRIALH